MRPDDLANVDKTGSDADQNPTATPVAAPEPLTPEQYAAQQAAKLAADQAKENRVSAYDLSLIHI